MISGPLTSTYIAIVLVIVLLITGPDAYHQLGEQLGQAMGRDTSYGREGSVRSSGRPDAARRRNEAVGRMMRRFGVVVMVVGVLAAVAAAPAPAVASAAGELYAFGLNGEGELGSSTNSGTLNPNPTPGLVSLPGATGSVVQAAAGYEHTLAVTSAGQLYAFGLNYFGQLGSATNNGKNVPNPTPGLVSLPGATAPVVQVAASYGFSLVVTSAGQLYAFGLNDHGQLGSAGNDGTANPNPTPALVSLPGATGRVVQAAAGLDFSLVVTSSGQLYAFGDNASGQLGTATNSGTLDPNPTPALVSLPGATGPVVQVAAGDSHSLAVTSSGQLYAFGDNDHGELGTASNSGIINPNPTPALVSLPGATGPVVQVAAGLGFSLVVTSTGQLYAFGDNSYGELGSATNSGTPNPNPTPALVSLPGAMGPVVQVAAAYEHTLAVTSTGQLYGFGLNQYGELGGAAITGVSPNPTPALVALPVGETADTVARGPEGLHSLVVTADLTVATGSLADGTVGAPYSQPVQASGGTPPYRWSERGLPAGLSIDPTTGTISGTPTQTGAFTVDVTLTDSDGIATSRSLSLMIAPRPPIAPAPSSKPVISGLSVSPHALSLSGRLVNGRCRPLRRTDPHNRACRRPLKLRISFTLSAASSVTISFANISAGRLVKSRCVKPTKANRRHRRCARRTALHGQITRTARHGANTITIIRSTLPPGTYQLTVTPRSGARAGTPETATIIITG